MISAHGVRHAYGTHEVLSDVSMSVGSHDIVGLIGPNGSGKTTLLRTLYRAVVPTTGAVMLDASDLATLRSAEIARAIAVVAQEAPGDLPLSVTDTVLLGRHPHLRAWQRQSESDIEVAADSLRHVGAIHLADRDLNDLSGGERQRVLIARALAQRAPHLLLDEPTNHLDIHFQHEVLEVVRDLGVTTVVVLHDLNLAARYCSHLVLLSDGSVAAEGTVDDVLRPAVLEPVYGIAMQRVIADDGVPQLLFRPPGHRRSGGRDHDAVLGASSTIGEDGYV